MGPQRNRNNRRERERDREKERQTEKQRISEIKELAHMIWEGWGGMASLKTRGQNDRLETKIGVDGALVSR